MSDKGCTATVAGSIASPHDYPPWLILHIPHDSTEIPTEVRDQFLISDEALQLELLRMTDHHTMALFAGQNTIAQVVRAAVSRLVVDVERFPLDEMEPMAKIGMGAVYTMTSDLLPLRRPLGCEERAALMANHFDPHHRLLDQAVENAIKRFGRATLLDCHSFPSEPLPYEGDQKSKCRPDICIGTDPFHTPHVLTGSLIRAFEGEGFKVLVDEPFSGALVPASRYRRDPRVTSVMIEVNRRLYMTEVTGEPNSTFGEIALRVRRCCAQGLFFGSAD